MLLRIGVCVYVCATACVCVHAPMRVYVFMRVCNRVRLYAYVRACMRLRVRMYVRVRTFSMYDRVRAHVIVCPGVA